MQATCCHRSWRKQCCTLVILLQTASFLVIPPYANAFVGQLPEQRCVGLSKNSRGHPPSFVALSPRQSKIRRLVTNSGHPSSSLSLSLSSSFGTDLLSILVGEDHHNTWTSTIIIVGLPFFWTQSSSSSSWTSSLQQLGEVSFLTLLCVALLQGALAVFQYRTNPSGELMIPPGLTVGEELPTTTAATTSKQQDSWPVVTTAMSSTSPSNSTRKVATPFFIETLQQRQQQDDNNNKPQEQSRYTSILQQTNRWVLVLIPWLAGHANNILQRNAHLLHIGSILTLTSILDLPQSFLQNYQKRKLREGRQHWNATTSSAPLLSLCQGDTEHLIVIGDSLAVGLGTVDQFDKNKTNKRPYCRIENVGTSNTTRHTPTTTTSTTTTRLKDDNNASPAFPKSLARTLSQQLQKRVTWRSAGVDGGDITRIRQYCLGVIEEDVKAGKTPDVVVILCGANDMKYCLSNPFQTSNWPKAFRSKLTTLIKEIQSIAPEVTVILPAIPTQMFHKNSPLNVFPLGLLLDIMVGFWDWQKKLVADSFNSKAVQYIGLSPREVSCWYHGTYAGASQQGLKGTVTLIARDGVHPNVRCYTNWAEAIGKKLLRVFQKSSSRSSVPTPGGGRNTAALIPAPDVHRV
jgi:lysophospholipase L1-like esterase